MLLTFEDVCDFLGTDEPTALALIEAGHLPPSVSIGGRLVRWRATDLVRWVEMGCPDYIAPTMREFTTLRERNVEEQLSLEESTALESDRADSGRINAGSEWTSTVAIPAGYRAIDPTKD